MQPREWRAGRIGGYRLRFNLEGRPRGKAAPANIEPHEEAEVWGVVYRITRRETRPFERNGGDPGMGLPADLARGHGHERKSAPCRHLHRGR